jgi:protein-S-isoprenylcysteine O-methyltransferase Ste14
MNWNRFQLLMLATAASIFLARALLLRIRSRLNIFKARHYSEVGFALGEAIVAVMILRQCQLIAFPLPLLLDKNLTDFAVFRWGGAGLLVAGTLLFVYALIALGNSWRVGIDRQTREPLVTTGIFRFSRNPIFVFLDLYVIGTFFINGTLIFLIAALATVAFLHGQILREEQFLQSFYGEAYRQYRTNTPRYF